MSYTEVNLTFTRLFFAKSLWVSLRIRMSPEQKERLVSYAERHYQTMSNVIFQALDILYEREEQQNSKK